MPIRSIQPGDLIPPGPPRRYRSSHGYWRLRWKVGKGEYLETYEHRVNNGRVTTAEHVHHRNGDKADNRPDNLLPTDPVMHNAQHRMFSPSDERKVAQAYTDGSAGPDLAVQFGCDVATIYKTLERQGVPRREANASRHLGRIDDAEIERRLRAGERPNDIALALGHSRSPVERVRMACGIPANRPGRPSVSS